MPGPVLGKGRGGKKWSRPGQLQELIAQQGRDHLGIQLTRRVWAGPGGKVERKGCGRLGWEKADQVRCVGRASQVQTQHGQRSGGGKCGVEHGPAQLEQNPT